MTVPTTSWDETSPAGSQSIQLGDNRIREMKTQVREVMDADHKFESSGQDADNGKHNQVSLIEAADIGSGAEGLPILGAQTINGKAELLYTDEDDNDIQMTKAGVKYPSQSTVLADWSTIMELIYPIGSVVTLGVTTNPGTLYGVGTWTAITGTVVVGIAGSGTFDTLDATGGAETHALSEAEMPAHVHTVTGAKSSWNDSSDGEIHRNSSGTQRDFSTNSTGSGDAHNNLQPYICKFIWQRVS